jgi:hypothetical protein
MSDIAVSRPERARRIIRGALVGLAAGALAASSLLLWPHVAGAVYYAPKVDRLFADLHVDPVLVEALRRQNAALGGKDEAWALEQDRIWNAERFSKPPWSCRPRGICATSCLRAMVSLAMPS